MNIAKDLPWDEKSPFLSSFLLRLQHVFIRVFGRRPCQLKAHVRESGENIPLHHSAGVGTAATDSPLAFIRSLINNIEN